MRPISYDTDRLCALRGPAPRPSPRTIGMPLPLRILILCTRNSARSQMAEALFANAGGERVLVGSAGSDPGTGVHPLAVAALAKLGIMWERRSARSITQAAASDWDLVITVCDAARDACPVLPGATAVHWGISDPAAVTGSRAKKLAAFVTAREALFARIVAALALPIEQLREENGSGDAESRRALVDRLRAIGAA